jgi:hypothetical protein
MFLKAIHRNIIKLNKPMRSYLMPNSENNMINDQKVSNIKMKNMSTTQIQDHINQMKNTSNI